MKHLPALSLLLPLLLTGCSNGQQPYTRTTFAMDTVMELTAYGPQAEAAVDAGVDELFRLQNLLSVTQQTSEVWALNHSGGTPMQVSGDTLTLLDTARQIGDRSGGALDVTLYPILRAWGFTTDHHQIPSEDTLHSLLTAVDYQAVQTEGNTVTLHADMELDFGALAKGYAGERCAAMMREQGITSALLNLGGNVQTVGSKPDGTPWRALIQDPQGESGDYVGVLELTDQAAVTSGGYQRNFVQDGITYWHILDPETGSPARSGLQSVTIVGDSGTLCDGLSTALFVLGREDALGYWRTYGGFEAILIDDDNALWVTDGLHEQFTWNEASGYTLNWVDK